MREGRSKKIIIIKKEEAICCADGRIKRERSEERGAGNLHTLTDKQGGRHGTTCSPEQEALSPVATPTEVWRVVQS